MKMHRSEEVWLIISFGMILAFMLFTGYQTFALGMGPPSHTETIDPQKVDQTAPFDNPGVFEIGENEYEVVMTLEVFSFTPNNIEVPAGSTVHFHNDIKRCRTRIPNCRHKCKCNGHAGIYPKD